MTCNLRRGLHATMFGLCFSTILFVAGCGKSTSTVQGKVTYAGKTVVWGSVTLVDSSGMHHTGEINLDGTYTVENVPSGPVKIGVYSPNPEAKGRGAVTKDTAKSGSDDPSDPRAKFMQSQGEKKASAPPRQPPAPGQWFPIPDKFTDPINSGLTGTVKSGSPLDVTIPQS